MGNDVSCDICGKPSVARVVVEGAVVNACRGCASLGRVLPARREAAPIVPVIGRDLFVAEDFGGIISSARAARGLTTPDLAKKLFLNEDYLKKIESGQRKPDVKTAQKLERELGIKLLVETPGGKQFEQKPSAPQKRVPDAGGLTLGEMAFIKKKN